MTMFLYKSTYKMSKLNLSTMSTENLHPTFNQMKISAINCRCLSVRDCFLLVFTLVGVFTEATIKIPALVSLN